VAGAATQLLRAHTFVEAPVLSICVQCIPYFSGRGSPGMAREFHVDTMCHCSRR
jgi:hypothetical protein